MSQTIAFLDFETTGLSPQNGDRPTEVAVAFVRSQRIVDRFQSLINPDQRISDFIVDLTGITNSMVSSAPSAESVMRKLHGKIQDVPIVAHNASFDRKFLETELSRIGKHHGNDICCSMRVARRIYPDAPNHKLGTLVDHAGLKFNGRAHRAMADAEMTARLWIEMEKQLEDKFGLPYVPFELMGRLQQTAKRNAQSCIREFAKSYDFDGQAPHAEDKDSVAKNKRPQKKSISTSPEGHVSQPSKPEPARPVMAVVCITCENEFQEEDNGHRRWIRCPGCGFKTPRYAIGR